MTVIKVKHGHRRHSLGLLEKKKSPLSSLICIDVLFKVTASTVQVMKIHTHWLLSKVPTSRLLDRGLCHPQSTGEQRLLPAHKQVKRAVLQSSSHPLCHYFMSLFDLAEPKNMIWDSFNHLVIFMKLQFKVEVD